MTTRRENVQSRGRSVRRLRRDSKVRPASVDSALAHHQSEAHKIVLGANKIWRQRRGLKEANGLSPRRIDTVWNMDDGGVGHFRW